MPKSAKPIVVTRAEPTLMTGQAPLLLAMCWGEPKKQQRWLGATRVWHHAADGDGCCQKNRWHMSVGEVLKHGDEEGCESVMEG